MKLRILTLLTLVCLSSFCVAQQGPPPRDLILTKRIFLAFTPQVKAELKLTTDQVTKMTDAFEGGLEVDGDRIKLMLNGAQDLGAMETEAIKILDAVQRKRLQEIWVQYLKGLALADEGIAKQVGLTESQKKETDRLVNEGGGAITELITGEPDPETSKKIDEIRAKYGKKMLDLLTADQKKAYDDLTGKPFEMKKKGQG